MTVDMPARSLDFRCVDVLGIDVIDLRLLMIDPNGNMTGHTNFQAELVPSTKRQSPRGSGAQRLRRCEPDANVAVVHGISALRCVQCSGAMRPGGAGSDAQP